MTRHIELYLKPITETLFFKEMTCNKSHSGNSGNIGYNV